jgi:aspartyl-tRNA(Asn)/glutamyl-tRNA(Gln) amidotransferase subunit A
VLALGALVSSADFVQAQRVRRATQRRLQDLLAMVDVVVSPTAAIGAPDIDSLGPDNILSIFQSVFTSYWDATGHPVLVVPMGHTERSLPLSLQIAGPPMASSKSCGWVTPTSRRPTGISRRHRSVSRPRPSEPSMAALTTDTREREEFHMPEPSESEVAVRTLLKAAGLSPSEDEIATLIAAYPAHKAGIESLYAIPEARYESPALIFNPTPVFADWAK